MSTSSLQAQLPPTAAYFMATGKYQENGDTLSDFVNLVCQEAQNSGNHSQVNTNSQPIRIQTNLASPQSPSESGIRSPTKLPQFYPSSMLPPPPPAPMARPVAIIRSTLDLSSSNSPNSPTGQSMQGATPETPGHSSNSQDGREQDDSPPVTSSGRSSCNGTDSFIWSGSSIT